MQPAFNHPWELSPAEAVALQKELASRVVVRDDFCEPLQTVGGIDVAYREDLGVAVAAAVLLDASTLETLEMVHAASPVTFPYVPGLLSFREIPALAQALAQLRGRPDLLLCDGHGIVHPRRLGLASHLGLIFDVPTIGCAKSPLWVRAKREPGHARGSRVELTVKGQVLGTVLRTKDGVQPLYISPGHRVSVATAPTLVLRFCTRYRLPEPTRLADREVGVRRGEVG